MATRKKKTTSPADEAPTPQAVEAPPIPEATPEVKEVETKVELPTPDSFLDEVQEVETKEELPVLDEAASEVQKVETDVELPVLADPTPEVVENPLIPDNLVTVMETNEELPTPEVVETPPEATPEVKKANHEPKLKVVAVNGKSGSGKTTTVIPHLCQRLNLQYIGTGDIFKAMLGCLLTTGSLFVSIPHTRQVSPYALTTFLESDYGRGLRYYEQLKISKALDDATTVYFIELLRCMCPDIAVRAVVEMAKARGLNTIITDAFSFEELEMLTSAVEVRGIMMLNCEDAKECEGNNRSLIAQSECDALGVPWVELQYRLGSGFDVRPYLDAISNTLEEWTR
jgi:hypothetical protein